ncbi:CbtA family protein [Nocardioides pyridinolyticus]
MSARAFLVRGLLAGLLAGLATFFVAHQVGEPHVERAIALEEAAASDGHTHAESGSESGAESHSHGDEDAAVSRSTQRTWGLWTASVAVGVALGGLVGLGAAVAAGRLGRLGVRGSTALVTLVGFVSVGLVPFLKYPATPPAVGSGDTIGERTAAYFGFLLLSVVVAVAVVVVAARLLPRLGGYVVVVGGGAAYLAVMVLAGQLFPTVNEIGDFPADTLWYFRRASLLTLATLWGVIGVVLVGLLGRLWQRESALAARRELAASL